MARFNSKEEYEKWKAEREEEIKKNPNRKTTAANAKSPSRTVDILADIKKTVTKISTLLHNWAEASQKRKAEKRIRQLEKLQAFKSGNKKINCAACRTSISINAVACPKCGQPLTDSARLDEVARIGRNHAMIAVVVAAFILLVLIGKMLPERPISEAERARQEAVRERKDAERATEEAERARQEYEQDERRRQLDALQPAMEEACRQGNLEACKQAKHWENIR